MTSLDRVLQRCLTSEVRCVDLGAVVKQPGGHLSPAEQGRAVQRGVAAFHGVHIGAVGKQQFSHVAPAGNDRIWIPPRYFGGSIRSAALKSVTCNVM